MSDQSHRISGEAPYKRFTIRLVDGHFVRVPAIGTVSFNGRHRPDGVQMLRATQKAAEEQGAEEPKPAASSFSAIPPSSSARYNKARQEL